ncbi:DUF4249 family protein [Flavobacterium hercynium]|uniref:DUF4249 domain-containing protein n=1 Tax=Flavobacterium hercynium TaxID=387094 RepID=A0A226H0S9_9FLAO|nr:DUF4249 family protein [Flavobacterium hercynium]OXA87271.1 hypothetical protein B0A66_16800 [Flavobacterium hercynium]SMP19533.1 protein of unknown function [Flavobacterium hercynium]
MKNITFLIVFLTSLFLTSCEDVIDVNLETAAPKLVIEASINWEKGTSGEEQIIKLSTTTGYFDKVIPKVSGAVVFITNSLNEQFDFVEIPLTGQYVCSNFEPVIDEKYTLTVINNGNTYTSTETLQAVTPITRIEQNNNGGLLGDEIEVKAFFNDPADQDNFYMFTHKYSNKILDDVYVIEDKFNQGSELSSNSDNADLETGVEVQITHTGISERYYNYIRTFLSTTDTGGGPFQSPPVKLKGNIVNTTDKNNYPLGYFSIGETKTVTYIIE